MQDYTFRWLDGRRPGEPDPDYTCGYDMNGAGVVVGEGFGDSRPFDINDTSRSSLNGLGHSIIWYPDHADVTEPDKPGPIAINDRGDMVGYAGTGDSSRVSFGGTVVSLMASFGTPDISIADINNRRIVTGFYGGTHYTNARAFILNAETGGPPYDFDLLRDASPRCASGWRINDNDHVIGYTSDYPQSARGILGWLPKNFLTTFFYADSSVIDLGNRQSYGLNDHDVVVGGRVSPKTGHTTAFALHADADALKDEDLGVLPDVGHNYSIAIDINNHGDIVGTSAPQAGSYGRAFLLPQDGTMIDLNSVLPPDSGWTLHSAIRINDSGQILCEGNWTHREFPTANGGYSFTAACLLTPELHIPFVRPERYLGDRYSLTAGSSGVWFGPGTRPVPINPNEQAERDMATQLRSQKRDITVALRLSELSDQIDDDTARADVESAARKLLAGVVDNWGTSP